MSSQSSHVIAIIEQSGELAAIPSSLLANAGDYVSFQNFSSDSVILQFPVELFGFTSLNVPAGEASIHSLLENVDLGTYYYDLTSGNMREPMQSMSRPLIVIVRST
jgi:hypothetical protein